jgi:predicted phosphodiesterase
VRYLILSDIHGNLQALEAVLEEAGGRYDRSVCLGDLVGYGADPNPVVEWVRANCLCIVRGNHDRACTGQEDLSWFNPVARAAALWTEGALTAENASYVRSLPQGPLTVDGFQLAHGSPLDEDEYVVEPEEALRVLAAMESRVVFFGHTHIQCGFVWGGRSLTVIPGAGGRRGRRSMALESRSEYLLNPGSVGQPRDEDPRAAFAIYDADGGTVLFGRVAYDVWEARQRILAAGLPEILGERLVLGR